MSRPKMRVWSYVAIHRDERSTLGMELPSFDFAVHELRELDKVHEVKTFTLWNERRPREKRSKG
jgi:hypothetical protein